MSGRWGQARRCRGIDWRRCTNIHRDVTHEDARRYYAHFGQREWARLAKSRRRPARVHVWDALRDVGSCPPASLQARQIDLAAAIMDVTFGKRQCDGAAA